MTIKYDINSMKLLTLFENVTGAKVKDCFENRGSMIYIVMPGEAGKAIGKKAVNIRRIESMIGKKIRVTEYSSDITKFVRYIIHPNKAKEITYADGIVTIVPEDLKARGYIIGRGGEMLRNNEEICKRYFSELKEIKVANV